MMNPELFPFDAALRNLQGVPPALHDSLVQVGDTLWLAGGGYVTVEKVTQSLLHTSGGKFHRATGARWQGSAWKGVHVVAIRTTTQL